MNTAKKGSEFTESMLCKDITTEEVESDRSNSVGIGKKGSEFPEYIQFKDIRTKEVMAHFTDSNVL